jgi:aspartyl-tRNA(Asn)/glutamyl-tRNA(Gln) amidotransferase subunit C
VSTELTREDVAKVAGLARLRLSEAELDLFTEQLSKVLAHADDLRNIDTSNVEATTHPFGLRNIVRPDVVEPSLDRDEVSAAAPDVEDRRFAVPRIVGEAP